MSGDENAAVAHLCLYVLTFFIKIGSLNAV